MKKALHSQLKKKARELGISEDAAIEQAVTAWLSTFQRPPNVTLADVAKAAGVSNIAVSYAMRDAGRLSEKNRKKIRRVAEKLGYVPNAFGQKLASAEAEKMADTHYSLAEAVDLLGLSLFKVRARIERGEIPAERKGRSWWIPKGAIPKAP